MSKIIKLPTNFTIHVGVHNIVAHIKYGDKENVGGNFVYDKNGQGDGIVIGTGIPSVVKFYHAIKNVKDTCKAGKYSIVHGPKTITEEKGFFLLLAGISGEGEHKSSFLVILFMQKSCRIYQVYETNDMTAEETLEYWKELPDE